MYQRAFAIATLFAALATASAPAQPRCSQETLNVRGTPVTIGYCPAGPPRSDVTGEILVPVAETYSSPAGTFTRQRQLHFLPGEGVSHVLDNVKLARLGMTGVLHLTLAYGNGAVWIEGAMLTPGAITIK